MRINDQHMGRAGASVRKRPALADGGYIALVTSGRDARLACRLASAADWHLPRRRSATSRHAVRLTADGVSRDVDRNVAV
jgi:hypothetical protein